MTNSKKPKGWVKEPVRHGLAAKGIKTGRKAPKGNQMGMAKSRERLRKLIKMEWVTVDRAFDSRTMSQDEIRKAVRESGKREVALREELDATYREELEQMPSRKVEVTAIDANTEAIKSFGKKSRWLTDSFSADQAEIVLNEFSMWNAFSPMATAWAIRKAAPEGTRMWVGQEGEPVVYVDLGTDKKALNFMQSFRKLIDPLNHPDEFNGVWTILASEGFPPKKILKGPVKRLKPVGKAGKGIVRIWWD